MTNRLQKLIAELKRRKVFQVGSLYLVTAWGLSMGVAELFPTFGAPDWAAQYVITALFLGFPIALVLAWVFEIRPERPLREPAARSPDNNAAATTSISPQRPQLKATWSDASGDYSKTFKNNLVIGRNPNCDVCIDDPSVSRRHAQISFTDGRWIIEDLGSSNGTLLNGARIGARIDRTALPAAAKITLSADVPDLTIEIDDLALAETLAQKVRE